jgi:transposase-like protein
MKLIGQPKLIGFNIMNLQTLFCPNYACPARGQVNQGNIHAHSQQEKRCRCDVCGKTFSVTKETLFYRLRTDPIIVMQVITLLAYGCPPEAVVAAYGFDRRTVSNWWQRAGAQCEAFHEHHVASAALDLQQVQADEIKVKAWGRSLWMGLCIMVATRLWLGGVVSPRRDKQMIGSLVACIRQMALCRPLLIAVDGLPHYVKALQRAFRSPVHEGKRARPRLVAWPNIYIGRVIKRKTDGVFTIDRQWVGGCCQQALALIHLSQKVTGVLNTAYIERLNATFRQRLAWLTRRSRVLAHQTSTLTTGMFVVGCFYNFCDPHKSLRLRIAFGSHDQRWIQRTPALAAGLTDHIWSHEELLSARIPPPLWRPPTRRGRRSKELQALVDRWC